MTRTFRVIMKKYIEIDVAEQDDIDDAKNRVAESIEEELSERMASEVFDDIEVEEL